MGRVEDQTPFFFPHSFFPLFDEKKNAKQKNDRSRDGDKYHHFFPQPWLMLFGCEFHLTFASLFALWAVLRVYMLDGFHSFYGEQKKSFVWRLGCASCLPTFYNIVNNQLFFRAAITYTRRTPAHSDSDYGAGKGQTMQHFSRARDFFSSFFFIFVKIMKS